MVFLDEDLLYYRRHHKNASRTKSLRDQIQTRLDLLLAHISYAVKFPARYPHHYAELAADGAAVRIESLS